MKTKTLISCAITAQLICAFVFTHAKSRISHNALKLNTILMFSALHNTINTFMQDLQVHLVQCPVHYLLHHGSTKELKVLCPGWKGYSDLINLSLDKIFD